MKKEAISRRNMLKGAGIAGVNLMSIAFPSSALAQSNDEVLPWLDQPPPPLPIDVAANLQTWEKLDTWITPTDRFFNVNHYGQPISLDEPSWRLEIAGLVSGPRSLSVAELRARQRREVDFTLECSGNNGFDTFTTAVGNARWTGTPLATLLHEAGILQQGTEVVFYGIDGGPVAIRDNVGVLSGGRIGKTEQDVDGGLDLFITEQFARSMSIGEALHPANLLCYEMNGMPLPAEHGFPLRLIAPGWYGVANVKWLTRIEIIDHRYAGRFMARDYVNIREQERNGQTIWTFTTVGHILLKSAPGRVVRRNNRYAVRGAAWGAPIAAVQVQIDDGPWIAAKLDSPSEATRLDDNLNGLLETGSDRSVSERRHSRGYAWTFWTFNWGRPASGEHTVRSRAIDINGNVQPAPNDPFLASKITYWESNGQITRRILVP
jgi:DMSO/TMAO reductase YedYZ molybdopterin-dependent catalytic subunit